MITVFASWLLFYVAEKLLVVSGILALMSFGMYLSNNGKTLLSHENDHAVHTVWSFLGFCLETSLFWLTGAIIGREFAKFDKLELEYNDIWKSILFYIIVFVIRYLVNILCLPLMNKVGYKITNVANLILSYGGLRGAIAMCLALIVVLDERLKKRFRDLSLFFTVVTILLSVLINSMTIKKLMQKTGFLKENLLKVKLFKSLHRQFLLKSLDYETNVLKK